MPDKIKVKIFTTPTCPWCKLTKDYLTKNKIEFENIDVTTDQKAVSEMMERSGEMAVPQLWIGNEVVVGFDQKRIGELLNIKDK